MKQNLQKQQQQQKDAEGRKRNQFSSVVSLKAALLTVVILHIRLIHFCTSFPGMVSSVPILGKYSDPEGTLILVNHTHSEAHDWEILLAYSKLPVDSFLDLR